MIVARHGLAHVEDSPTALTQAPGQVRVLVVHEQVLAKASQCLPRLTPNRAGASAQAEDLAGGVLLSGGHQPVPVIAVAGGVHQVARGVDQDLPLAAGSGLLIEAGPPPGARGDEGVLLAGGGRLPASGQQDPRRGRGRSRSGRRVAQGGQERLEEAGLGHRVIVEQDEDILDHAPGPEVDTGSEAPVLARLDHRESLSAKSLGRAVTGGVVHDDEYVLASQLLTDGAGRPDRQLGLAPVDDDDAG